MIFELVQDLSDALAWMPRDLYGRSAIDAIHLVLNANAHELRPYPTILFQQVYNALSPQWGTADPTAQSLAAASRWCRHPWMRRIECTVSGATSLPLRTVEFHAHRVEVIRVDVNGRIVTSVSTDGTTVRWELATGVMLASEPGQAIGLPRQAESITSNGRFLVRYFSEDAHISLYDKAASRELCQLEAESYYGIDSLALAEDRRTVAATSWDRVIVWDVKSGQRKEWRPTEGSAASLSRHRAPAEDLGDNGILSVAISPSGETIACGNASGVIRIWRKDNGEEWMRLQGHGHAVRSLAFAPSGQNLLSGDDDGKILVWDLSRCKPRTAGEEIYPPVTAAAISHSGLTFVTGGEDGSLAVWNQLSPRPQQTFPRMYGSVGYLAFSSDDRLLACSSHDGEGAGDLFVLDVGSGTKTGEWIASSSVGYPVAFSPDGSMFFYEDSGGIHAVGTNSCRRTAEPSVLIREAHGCSLASSPDGCMLAVGGFEGVVSLWDWRRNRRISRFVGHGSLHENDDPSCEVCALAFSRDGRVLASGSMDCTAILWDVVNGKLLRRLADGGHGGPVWCLAFSPDGRFLASGGADGYLIVWDIRLGAVVSRVPLPDQVYACTFHGNTTGDTLRCVRIMAAGRVRTVPDIWHAELMLPVPDESLFCRHIKGAV